MARPDNVSEKDFAAAIAAFRGVVGEDWVFTDDSILETYRDTYAPLRDQEGEPVASGAVAPANVEEVRQVVRIASDYNIPLWTVSTGRNFGYGGPAGVVSGSVTLDLKRMNRILEVNEKYAYALVEPGVSFFELYRYLQENKIKLWLDVPGPGWGSIIGNTIEHGMGYTPYSDRMNYQCGMEVVLADGDLVRTGMGALPDADTWMTYKHGLGPNVDGLFYQTNYGVVTKMGVWLMPEPQTYLSCKIKTPHYKGLIDVIDNMREARIAGIIQNNATVKPSDNWVTTDGVTFTEPGGWYNQIAFYGLPEVVDRHWEYVQDAYAGMEDVEFIADRYDTPLDSARLDDDARSQAGIPQLGIWGHPLFAAPVLPFDGQECFEHLQLYDQIAQKYGRRYFGSWMHADTARSIITTAAADVIRDDLEYNRDSIALVNDWIKASTERGWGIYRMHTVGMDQARAAYSFNDHALLRLHEAIKDTLDPVGIFSPGKNGIWPKHMRGDKA